MHLIEAYATSSGLKINKPFIYDKFFPVPVEKYISFQPFSKYNSKNYSYWNEVISIINPFLQKENIHIVQIGGPNDKPIQNCINFCGQTKIPHAAFIIKNSLMHVGADSFGAHVASGYGKKIVAIYSNNNINNVKPYWTKDQDMILLEPKRANKPNYSAEENPKTINQIKPEQIAKSILKLLNIKNELQYDTIFIGERYNDILLEAIPSLVLPPNMFPNINLNIRFDYIKDIEEKDYICTLGNLNIRNCSIITDKPLEISYFAQLKDKISNIFYDITHNNIDFEFVQKVKLFGLKIDFIFNKSRNQNEIDLNNKKLELIDYPELITIIETKDKPKNEIKECSFYKSKKILFANNNTFLSKAAFLENKPVSLTENLDISQSIKEIKDINSLIDEDGDYCLFYK
jgi:hypothetical protein